MDLSTGAKVGAAMIVIGAIADMAGLFLAAEIAGIGPTARRWVFAIGTAVFLTGTSLVIFSPDVLATIVCAIVLLFVAATIFGTIIKLSDSEETSQLLSNDLRGGPAPPAPSQPVSARALDRDVWVYDAIWRIYSGRWERRQFDASAAHEDIERLHDVLKEIRQAAADGLLPVWGKLGPVGTLWEPIPKGAWSAGNIDWFSFEGHGPEHLWMAGSIESGWDGPHGRGNWTVLRTSRAKVDELWPAHTMTTPIPTFHFVERISGRLRYANEAAEGTRSAETYVQKLPIERISLTSLNSIDQSCLTRVERDALLVFIDVVEEFNNFAVATHSFTPQHTAHLARHRLANAARALNNLIQQVSVGSSARLVENIPETDKPLGMA